MTKSNPEYVAALPDLFITDLKNSMNRGEIYEIRPDGSTTGMIRKHLVDHFSNLKVEIFSNEHPPPHFRVKFQSYSANFKIFDCSKLNGDKEVLKFEKNIYLWWKDHKKDLIRVWDETRPGNCPVGCYKE